MCWYSHWPSQLSDFVQLDSGSWKGHIRLPRWKRAFEKETRTRVLVAHGGGKELLKKSKVLDAHGGLFPTAQKGVNRVRFSVGKTRGPSCIKRRVPGSVSYPGRRRRGNKFAVETGNSVCISASESRSTFWIWFWIWFSDLTLFSLFKYGTGNRGVGGWHRVGIGRSYAKCGLIQQVNDMWSMPRYYLTV